MIFQEVGSLDHSKNVGVLDSGYWNHFYEGDEGTYSPSLFAQFCQETVFKSKCLNIFEAGCGNGRDAMYFGRCLHKVVAIDQSESAITLNKTREENQTGIEFKSGDFISELSGSDVCFDVVYSRFTLHAIDSYQQERFLVQSYQNLDAGGLLCIEVRTVNDELFGVGKRLGDNAFYSDHYRRFIVPDELLSQVKRIGFNVQLFSESRGFAPYKGEDPKVLRVVLEKYSK